MNGPLLHVGTAMMLATASAANATITIYTSQASYLAAISSTGVDTFDDMPGAFVASPLSRTAGSYGYSASAPNGACGPKK